MKALRFRVQNYRNIDDSHWIELEQVTAFVGRNESGKTALLKALHKFNPGQPEPYDPQREFPRDRYSRDYIRGGSQGGNWPVASVEFEIPESIQTEISTILDDSQPPAKAVLTRFYDGSLRIEYEPPLCERPVVPEPVLSALNEFASSARRLERPDMDPEQAGASNAEMARWAMGWCDRLKDIDDLRENEGADYLTTLRDESEDWSAADADMVETLQTAVNLLLGEAEKESMVELTDQLIEENLPVFIYFEDYGILDSAVWLPRFIGELQTDPTNARVRTVNAMFQHVGLDPSEITALGNRISNEMRLRGENPSLEQIVGDQKLFDERAIQLNAASNDISSKFSEWWSQRRHRIRYDADGDFFRIWIADNRRPDVEIELEARSKGFQWFFSFYLVFLVESNYGHKDAILLLDEPGLHLHATAQQELIAFFERLSETNQLAYTTHSPFLIDGEHLHRVRPVTEDDTGHSRVTAGEWPTDRETIFPLQAAAGYAMLRGLFQHQKNVLVEGMSDFYYLHALSLQCSRTERTPLPDDVYITPCGGTRYVGTLASLFMGHEVRALVLLDGDEAGRARRNSLLRNLYANHSSGIIMLDDLLNRPGQEVEIEDILGEDIVLEGVESVLGQPLTLLDTDRAVGSLPSQIEAAARRQDVELPEMWKGIVALKLVSSWAENGTTLPTETLETAASLFSELRERFNHLSIATEQS